MARVERNPLDGVVHARVGFSCKRTVQEMSHFVEHAGFDENYLRL